MLAEKLLEGYNGFYNLSSGSEISDPIAYLTEACIEACIALEEAAQQYYTADIIGQSQVLMEGYTDREILMESVADKAKQLWIKFKEKVKEIFGKIIEKLKKIVSWIKSKFKKSSSSESSTTVIQSLKIDIETFDKKRSSSQPTRPDDRPTNSKSPSAKKSEIQISLITDQKPVTLALPMKDSNKVPVPDIYDDYNTLMDDISSIAKRIMEFVSNELKTSTTNTINVRVYAKTDRSPSDRDTLKLDPNVDSDRRTFDEKFEDMNGIPNRFKGTTASGLLRKIDNEFDNIVRNASVTQMHTKVLSQVIDNMSIDKNIDNFIKGFEEVISIFEKRQKTLEELSPDMDNEFVNRYISVTMMHINCGISAANFYVSLFNKRMTIANKAINIMSKAWNNYKGQV